MAVVSTKSCRFTLLLPMLISDVREVGEKAGLTIVDGAVAKMGEGL